MRRTVLFALLLLPSSLLAQSTVAIGPLADSIAGAGSSALKTQRLVHWVNDRFQWSATDYVRRTPAEVIARRGGNCAELSSVLRLLLDSIHVTSRWVREINVQPGTNPRRQQTAEQKVVENGNGMSVFGLQHNDHVWLEVWDDSSKSWFPADPAYGVVGLGEWLPARLAFADRPKPRVAAVEPIAAEMLVPFVVTSGPSRGANVEDRTQYYLIEQFDRLYGGKLRELPAWQGWVQAVQSVSPHARAAFAGKENLHNYTADIAKLKASYDALQREANGRGIRWSR